MYSTVSYARDLFQIFPTASALKLGDSGLVPRPRPAFRLLKYGKAAEGLEDFIT